MCHTILNGVNIVSVSQFAPRGHDRMLTQNDKSFSGFLGELFQSPAYFQILAAPRFKAESAEFLEGRRFDKHERANQQPAPAKSHIHHRCQQVEDEMPFVPANSRAAGKAVAGPDFSGHIGKSMPRLDGNRRPRRPASRRWLPPRLRSARGKYD